MNKPGFNRSKKQNINIEDFIFEGRFPLNNRTFFMKHLAPYVFFSDLCTNKNILDIGIGQGYGTFLLSNYAGKATALDFDFSCGDNFLRKYIERFKKDNIRFVCGNALSLPFPERVFDRVITCQVIEHIPEDKLSEFLNQIKHVLKDDGVLFVSTLNREHDIKDPATYKKFSQHHKEFNKDDLYPLLKSVFPRVDIYGLNLTFKHRFFLRLKRWGFLKYSFFGVNPVASFFNTISPRDFKVSPNISRRSLDLFALCYKN